MKKTSFLKRTMAIACAAAVMVSYTPAVSYGWTSYDDLSEKYGSEEQYNDNESAISKEITDKVAEAAEKAGEAVEAAGKAAEAAGEAATEAAKADAALNGTDAAEGAEAKDGAADVADSADGKKDTAVSTHSDGEKYIAKTEKEIKDAVDTAVGKVEGYANAAETAQGKAEAAQQKAEQAKAAAFAADTKKDADKAAKEAKAAAAEAATELQNAETARDNAKTELKNAKEAFETAKKAAVEKVNEYNTTIGNLGGEIAKQEAELAALEKAFHEAEANAKAAEAKAKTAKENAETANTAAQDAANAVLNFDVNPKKAEADRISGELTAAKGAEAQALANRNAAVEAEGNAHSAYEAIVTSTTEAARAAQDAVVAEKQAAYDKAKSDWDDLSWLQKEAQKIADLFVDNKYTRYVKAERALNEARSTEAYDAAVTAALQATPEWQAWDAAKAAIPGYEAAYEAAQKAAGEKQTELNNASAALSGAEGTRDAYIAALKAELDKPENNADVEKAIVDALKAEILEKNASVNEAQLDRYIWSRVEGVKDLIGWFDKDGIGAFEASETRGIIDRKYNCEDWLNATGLGSYFTDTDDAIEATEAAYKAALLVAEQKLAMNEAYAEGTHAAKALAAAQASYEAAQASADLADASKKLEEARAKYNAAKKTVDELSKLAIDLSSAEQKLKDAEKAVERAENAVTAAKKAKDAADLAAKQAEKCAYRYAQFSVLKSEYNGKAQTRPATRQDNDKRKYYSDVAKNMPKLYVDLDEKFMDGANEESLAVRNHTSILEKKGETATFEVENALKSITYTDVDYEAVMAKINAAAVAAFAEGEGYTATQDGDAVVYEKDGKLYNIAIDWYELKRTGKEDINAGNNYWEAQVHVDGECLVTEIVKEEPVIEDDPQEDPQEDPKDNPSDDNPQEDPQDNPSNDDPQENPSGDDPQENNDQPNNDDKPANNGHRHRNNSNNEQTIPESEVPLSELPDDEVPLSDLPGDMTEEEIPEDEVPLAELPQTGGIGVGIFLLAGGAIAAAGVGFRKREDEE